MPEKAVKKHIMYVLSNQGDTQVEWDTDIEETVKKAEGEFANYVQNLRFAAFAGGAGVETPEQIRSFDPNAEEIVMVPQIVGG